MRPDCPNSSCEFFESKEYVHRDGQFYRQSEARFIQRFKCSRCQKKFSHATGTLEYRHKKRRVNLRLKDLLCSGVSLRRAARVLHVHRTTIERKTVYLAKKARLSQQDFLKSLRNKVCHLQFDDLITSEHTKLKPLTVTVAVDVRRRFILGVEVAPIAAFGHLAEISRKKYGRRKNMHSDALEAIFKQISPVITKDALVESDEHKLYPEFVIRHLPGREHKRYKGGRGCVAGQGELKRLHYDPLFILNHTCAMLRANINRLIRKTWCTTKDPKRLQMHLDIFVDYYNQSYLKA